jgi:Ca-activated chloride channel family protein
MKQQLELTIRQSRKAIARVGGALHLLVRAVPPAQPIQADRRAVALALVIDRSGSMAGPAAASITPDQPSAGGDDTGQPSKLGFVKAATLRLLDLMHDGDAVTLIAFDDTVQVVKPLTVLSERSRGELAAAVKGLETGGSTNIDGGLKAGLDQFSKAIRVKFGCKLVLLSDGEANVGEVRPAVLGERAAGAAHNGVTTSTLGFGFDYNIALMSHLAEAGNGDFTHIESLQSLDAVLREEFTTAADVTARAVEVAVELAGNLSVGTNLNAYRQEPQASGFKVFLGDLVRPKEFIFEITTPVEVDGDEMTITARATYRDGGDVEVQVAASIEVTICSAKEVNRFAVDPEVVAKVLAQLPALAEMQAYVALEAGNAGDVDRTVKLARDAIKRLKKAYPMVAGMPELALGEAKIADLDAGGSARTFSAMDLKRHYGASRRSSRARPVDPDDPK